jgi:hypothetical protein
MAGHRMLQRMKKLPFNDSNKPKDHNTVTHTDDDNDDNGYDINMILNLNNKIINCNSMAEEHTRNM